MTGWSVTGRIVITASMTSAICSGVYFSRSNPIDTDMGLVADMLTEIVLCNKGLCESGNLARLRVLECERNVSEIWNTRVNF